MMHGNGAGEEEWMPIRIAYGGQAAAGCVVYVNDDCRSYVRARIIKVDENASRCRIYIRSMLSGILFKNTTVYLHVSLANFDGNFKILLV